MEFNFNIEKAIGNISNNGICFLDGRNYQKYNKQTFSNLCFLFKCNHTKIIDVIIIKMKITIIIIKNTFFIFFFF